jgi:Fn3-like domain
MILGRLRGGEFCFETCIALFLLKTSSHRVAITNTGKTSRKYKLSHVAAGTALTMKEVRSSLCTHGPDSTRLSQNSILPELAPVPLSNAAASVVISPSEFTLLPGQSRQVIVTVSPPQGIDASRYPVYSGFILIDSPGETQKVTYLGLAARIKDKRILDDDPGFYGTPLPVVTVGYGDAINSTHNFTFTGDYDFPSTIFRLAFGTQRLRIDLVDPNIKLPTTLNPRGPIPPPPGSSDGHIFTFPSRTRPGSFASVKTVGSILEFTDISRDAEVRRSS